MIDYQLPIHLLIITLLAGLTYLWASEMVGRLWATLPAALFLLSALNFQNEITITAALFMALWGLLNFLLRPSLSYLVLSGITLGGAFIAGPESDFLILLFPFLVLLFYIAGLLRDWPATASKARRRRFGLRAFRFIRATIFIIVIGFIALAGFRFFEKGDLTPLTFIENFKNLRSAPPLLNYPEFTIAKPQQVPLPALVFLSLAFVLALIRLPRWGNFYEYLTLHFTEFSFLIFTGALLLYHPTSTLPALPFLYILAASSFKKWLTANRLGLKIFQYDLALSLKTLILSTIILWYLVQTLPVINTIFNAQINIF